MMLSLDTAYRSFDGEVEASSTPTICRLSDSRRHQLWAIAHEKFAPTLRAFPNANLETQNKLADWKWEHWGRDHQEHHANNRVPLPANMHLYNPFTDDGKVRANGTKFRFMHSWEWDKNHRNGLDHPPTTPDFPSGQSTSDGFHKN